MKLREKRMITGRVEKRALTAEEKSAGWIGALTGRIPLNSDSVLLRDRRLNGGQPFIERIASKAFAGAEDVMAMAGHTEETLGAFARQGVNLTLTHTADELRYDALLPATTAGRDLLELADKQIVRGTSFEFEVGADDKWEKRADGTAIRIVERGKLLTVNPVIWPAYDDSSLSVSLRGRRAARADDEAGPEERGQYLCTDSTGRLDWYDPTVSADLRFAQNALARATWALADALEYLRAVAVMAAQGDAAGAGAHAALARAEVAAAAERATALVAWLAASGAEVNPAALQRATERIAAGRAALAVQASSSQPDHDRERRARILTLGSR